ncbi:hypothetical protein K493DRAFT_307493 [Basidiobolus meristosporus CBS 931.73]|uniref:Uncharacterized protein n=1 Tax=Basidiobolus meristosporus CBS 931.73 TaxID=1314790 RepID=A0A1Y1XE48_9FUNG|nr:hypothetical protein K493DRAFT_307493 [Basidiobolus meristosporus CBS 931.73]|eukprot:ORX84051.1 hypothetical protein K493DRAFT_307493 [Basidiobolus meristosporus CBS 931.73]
MNSSPMSIAFAIQFPVLGVRHFITQLVGIDLVKTDQKIRGMVVQSVFDGNAYLIDPQALNSSTDIADGTEEVKGEPKASKKLVLSAVDQSATGMTINSRYLTRMKEEDVPLILSSNLSVYRIPESKVITYLGSIGSLICAAKRSLQSLGYIPGASMIEFLMCPVLYYPFLCKNSLYKGPVFINVKVGNYPSRRDYLEPDTNSNGPAALATMDTGTVPIACGPLLSKFNYWFNAYITFSRLAEPVVHCLCTSENLASTFLHNSMMSDYRLDNTAFNVLYGISIFSSAILKITWDSRSVNHPENYLNSDYEMAMVFPLYAIRHYITQLVGTELVDIDQKSLKTVIQSVFEGRAYLITPIVQSSKIGTAEGTEKVESERNQSKKLELSLLDHPDTRMTAEYKSLMKVKKEDIPWLLQCDLSVYRMRKIKIISYFESVGALCVTSLWIHSLYVVAQSLQNQIGLPGAMKITRLMIPLLFIPLLCKTSLSKGPVYITAKVDGSLKGKGFIESNIRGNGINAQKAADSSEIGELTPQKILICYRIQRLLGSLLYMILYYAVYFVIVTLATLDTDPDSTDLLIFSSAKTIASTLDILFLYILRVDSTSVHKGLCCTISQSTTYYVDIPIRSSTLDAIRFMIQVEKPKSSSINQSCKRMLKSLIPDCQRATRMVLVNPE